MKKNIFYTASLIVMAFVSPSVAFSWGGAGHEITGQIAQMLLTDRASIAVDELYKEETTPAYEVFSGMPLATISVWPDKVKKGVLEGDGSSGWHFINFEYEDTDPAKIDLVKNCTGKVSHYFKDGLPLPVGQKIEETREDNCSILKAAEFFRILSDSTKPAKARLVALKYLVHIIGDMHQPLHNIAWNNDAGGNSRGVSFMGHPDPFYGPLNLHSVWDDNIIRQRLLDTKLMGKRTITNSAGETKESEAPDILKYSEKLVKDPAYGSVGDSAASRAVFWHEGNLVRWAWEGAQLARSNVYSSKLSGGLIKRACCDLAFGQKTLADNLRVALTNNYYETNWPVVEQQLVKGGVRLAMLLNMAFE